VTAVVKTPLTRWSSERPSTGGFYWYRTDASDIEPQVVEIIWNYEDYNTAVGDYFVHECGCETENPLNEWSGEWQPVQEPV
jgi:hypothetical protein